MKALQVTQGPEFQIVDLPVPPVGPGEVRVKVEAVTICAQWDLHLRANEPMYAGHQFHYPYTVGQPGHEGSGVVDAIGDGVTGLSVGDRVSLWRDPGHHIQGVYGQFVVRPEVEVIRVPARLEPYQTASLELAMCVAVSFQTLRKMDAVAGSVFGVGGLGPAGLIACQMARAEGAAEVIGLDLDSARRELALKLGASEAYDPREGIDESLPLRPRARLTAAIDCVGSRRVFEMLLDRVDGPVALFGVQREDFTFSPRHYLGASILGYRPHNRAAAEYAVGLLESGKLDLGAIVSHHFPLEGYGEAMELLVAQKAHKVCLYPWGR